jgi:hypothetical protein
MDELLVFKRAWSVTEVGRFNTDAHNSFRSVGTWTSPSESGDNYPTLITLVYGNVSATRTISLIQLQTPTGIVFFSRNVAITSGSIFAIIPTFPIQAVSGNWTVSLTLTGNNTGTPFVSSIVIGLALSITVPPTLDTNAYIFILLLLAYVVLLIIAWYDDSVAWFIPAGIVMQLIAFQGWTVTTSLPVAISLSVVGIVTLLVPIGHALRGKPS